MSDEKYMDISWQKSPLKSFDGVNVWAGTHSVASDYCCKWIHQ